MPETVVVVGAGIAGLRTVESLRRRGFPGQVTMLGAEPHPPYDRPPLSKQLLRGEQDDTSLRTVAELRDLDVTLRLDDPAHGLDLDRRVVRTAGDDVPFDVAVVATGAGPRRLPGLDGHVLRTLDHARTVRDALRSASRIGVVGAGLIGCEVAASARTLGVEVELVDVLAGPMIRVLGPQVAEHMARLHTEHGVELRMSTAVTRGDDGRVHVAGRPWDVDLVVEAVGVRPATDWLAGSGLTVDDGVVCDGHGQAADGVYAVGDVARWAGVRNEHWTSATTQADHVAAVVLGQPAPPADVPYWWSDQYGLKIQGLGRPGPDDTVDVLVWGPKRRTVAVWSRDGRLTAAVGFGAAGAVMRLRGDITAGTPVDQILDRLRN